MKDWIVGCLDHWIVGTAHVSRHRSTRPSIRPRGRRRAFTLVELMVVVVLIGIMAAVILPEMKGTFEDAVLRSTARKLVDAARLAHSQSITVNAGHRVRIDAGTGRYVVERAVRNREQGLEFVPLQHLPGGQGPLDARISIVVRGPADESPMSNFEPPPVFAIEQPAAPAPSRGIVFYPDGTADAAEILLRDREGFGLSLRISPVTARVKIAPIGREN